MSGITFSIDVDGIKVEDKDAKKHVIPFKDLHYIESFSRESEELFNITFTHRSGKNVTNTTITMKDMNEKEALLQELKDQNHKPLKYKEKQLTKFEEVIGPLFGLAFFSALTWGLHWLALAVKAEGAASVNAGSTRVGVRAKGIAVILEWIGPTPILVIGVLFCLLILAGTIPLFKKEPRKKFSFTIAK